MPDRTELDASNNTLRPSGCLPSPPGGCAVIRTLAAWYEMTSLWTMLPALSAPQQTQAMISYPCDHHQGAPTMQPQRPTVEY